MEPYELETLGNGEYAWTKNGRIVRVKITETTANLAEQDRVAVRGFKGQVWEVNETGAPEAPDTTGPVYLSQGVTVPRAMIADNESFLTQQINKLAAELAEKGLVLCATNARTAQWIPSD